MNQPCYEETKKKIIFQNRGKTGHGGQPLIRNHRSVHDVSKEKQNEKHITDYHPKNRPQNIVIGEHEPFKPHVLPLSAHSYIPPATYTPVNNGFVPEKFLTNQPLINATVQFQPPTNRNLTFGNVRNTHVFNLKGRQHEQTQPQMHYIPLEKGEKKGKSALFEKQNISHDKVTDRIQKKDKSKTLSNITPTSNKAVTDDEFACNEELQFRPVQKKSLIPQKKGEKTTSKFDFIKNKKNPEGKKIICEKQRQKQLKQFAQFVQKKVNIDAQAESLLTMTNRQQQYSVDPLYIEKNQRNMTWLVRAILVDWMRHVSYEYCLRRETYHIAVVLLDNYLAKTNHLPKSSLQAIGATCMFIASKLEEFQCKSSQEWVGATNNCCTAEDIHELEIRIVMKTLKFKINPPTLWSLSNKIMSQWDIFLTTHEYASTHPIFDRISKPFFKCLDQQSSYVLFRDLMQSIDCSLLDIQTAQYKPKMLVLSFMYLVIGLQMRQWEKSSVVDVFPRSSRYLTNPSSDYNDLFGNFVMYCFGSHLQDLLPTVQYAATYFSLPLSYEHPRISQSQVDLQGIQLEEYYSYQTYNTAMMKTVKGRQRGVYLQGAYQ